MTSTFWTPTYSGLDFDLLNPSPESVSLVDICQSLSKICRFNGNTRVFYSVAEHCIHVANLCPRELRPLALLHDACEAYTGDITSPMKGVIGDQINTIENRVLDAVFKKFGLFPTSDELAIVKKADIQMLFVEKQELMFGRNLWLQKSYEGVTVPRVCLFMWSPDEARREYERELLKCLPTD